MRSFLTPRHGNHRQSSGFEDWEETCDGSLRKQDSWELVIGGPCVMSPQVTGGSLGYVHVSPHLFVLLNITDHALSAVGSIPGSCQALYDLRPLLSPTSSPVPPVSLLSSSPPYSLLLEHSTSIPTPKRFCLHFLLSWMPFAQLPSSNSLGLSSAMPWKRGFPFHPCYSSSIHHIITSLVCRDLCLCRFSVLFTTVIQCPTLSRQ